MSKIFWPDTDPHESQLALKISNLIDNISFCSSQALTKFLALKILMQNVANIIYNNYVIMKFVLWENQNRELLCTVYNSIL